MKKLIKLIIFWLFPVSFILVITFALNIFILDFRYGHQSHMIYQPPFSWSKYYINLYFKKFIVNTFVSKKIGLPQVHIYLNEQSQQKLLSNTPNSTKQWVKGSMLNSDGILQEIQIRYRGDNPQNWLLEKKNLRIKTRKKEMHDRKRYYEYTGFDLELFPINNIANRMGVLTNNSKLIELYVNGQSNGVFMQDERFDENFLRRNRIMPVNLYKGENHNIEKRIGLDENLYNNPGLWVKTAIFNQKSLNDKSDLKRFLSILQSAEVKEEDFEKLLEYLDLETWARYASFLILSKSYQADHLHNVRIAIDPWSGYVIPILQDPHPVNIDQKIYTLEYSKDDLLALLNRSSIFIDKKYDSLFNFVVNSKVLSKEVDYFNEIKDQFSISLKRDPEINFKEMLYSIEIFKNNLNKAEKEIENKLLSKPSAGWRDNSENINVFVEGEMPITNIEFIFNNEIPEWIALDTNYNGVIDEDENKFYSNGKNNIILPVKLYANRVSLSKRKTNMFAHPNFKIQTSPTKFNIITEKAIKPKDIKAQSIFSNDKFLLRYLFNFDAAQTNKFNKVIFKNDLSKVKNNMKNISGQVFVNQNLIYTDPVNINPGTNFIINEGSHIIFKNKVIANGTKKNPIIFKRNEDTYKPWGTIGLIGPKTSKSELSNIIIDGGSGGNYNQINFTSMFSLHNTKEINLKNLKFINHSKYDDMMHVIYCENVIIDKAEFLNAPADAIDVDISSNVRITNSKFINSNNDAIDFMESEALVDSTVIYGSKDKGLSIGESSNVLIYNTLLEKNNIGLATKDKSSAKVLHVNFKDNNIQLSAYKKNWQYGDGGSANIYRSYFIANQNLIEISKESDLEIIDTSIVGSQSIKGKNIKLNNVDFYETSFNDPIKKISKNNLKIIHPMYSKISKTNNQIRGFKLN